MSFVWQSLILVFAGVILLRIAGRKSISQMTVAQTVIMISIGTLIIQPIVETSVWKAIASSAIFIATLLVIEYLQIKFNFFERLITGQSKVVIQNGIMLTENLRKLRFTVDQLEMRLRQQGISKISDLQYATLEPNGLLGYELKREARPVTVGDLEQMLKQVMPTEQGRQEATSPLFEEITNGHGATGMDKLQ